MTGYTRGELEELLISVSDLLRTVAPVHALIGGAAVMFYGHRARTRDVDFLVCFGPHQQVALVAEAEQRGFTIERKAVWHLRLWRGDQYADLITAEVDVQLEAARAATERQLQGGPVRLVPAEHLVALKILAGRPRDRHDVENIAEVWTALDVDKVNRLLAPWDLVWRPGDLA